MKFDPECAQPTHRLGRPVVEPVPNREAGRRLPTRRAGDVGQKRLDEFGLRVPVRLPGLQHGIQQHHGQRSTTGRRLASHLIGHDTAE